MAFAVRDEHGVLRQLFKPFLGDAAVSDRHEFVLIMLFTTKTPTAATTL